jgi:hypothetical protein
MYKNFESNRTRIPMELSTINLVTKAIRILTKVNGRFNNFLRIPGSGLT